MINDKQKSNKNGVKAKQVKKLAIKNNKNYSKNTVFDIEKNAIDRSNLLEGLNRDELVYKYIKNIKKYKLLTYDEVNGLIDQKLGIEKLIKKYRINSNLTNIDKHMDLFNVQEKKIVENGKLAFDKIIKSNLWLVVLIAKKFPRDGHTLLYLIQEGNAGLIKGVEKLNHKNIDKLSWWIRQAISRAISDSNKVKKITSKVTDDSSILDFMSEIKTKYPESVSERKSLMKKIEKRLTNLNDREKKVMRLRFGIYDGKPKTLIEVAKLFNVTYERVRQIEDKALRKMKICKKQ